jgi:hypothetical protein
VQRPSRRESLREVFMMVSRCLVNASGCGFIRGRAPVGAYGV